MSGSGTADLYLGSDAPAYHSNNVCASVNANASETCTATAK
jgi:hypothetical protein